MAGTIRQGVNVGARKQTEDHGGVLTPHQAFYHAVHDYNGGLPAVAAVYGWNQATLRNKVLPSVKTHKPTLEDFEAVLALTGDPRLLTSICHTVGAVWHWADEVEADPADLDVLACGSAMIDRSNGALQELVKALADGEVDADEMARIKQRAYEVRQTLAVLVKTAEGFVG